MKSSLPKVLHSTLGRTLVGHVLAATQPLGAKNTVVVIGHGRDEVTEELYRIDPQLKTAVQEQQNGTGHAVQVALDALGQKASGTVVVLAGDTPLLTSDDLHRLINEHDGAAATILTAQLENPFGYGRIVRSADGTVNAIVEERDATDEQRAITEVNSGVYAFDGELLVAALSKVGAANDQGEQYLTDVIGILREQGHVVRATVTHEENILGVNDRRQLAEAGYVLQARINSTWMLSGVTMVDPDSTFIDATVTLQPDVKILPNVQLTGTTTISSGAVVGPDSTLHNTSVGEDAIVVLDRCVIARCAQRPYRERARSQAGCRCAVHRDDLRRHHDDAGPAEGAERGEDRHRRDRQGRRAVLTSRAGPEPARRRPIPWRTSSPRRSVFCRTLLLKSDDHLHGVFAHNH